MLRTIIFVGVVTGTAAVFPLLYEQNPEFFHSLIRSPAAAPAPPPTPIIATVQPRERQQVALMEGRKVQLAPDGRGHFIGDFRMNGYRVQAMVDTGATLVAMNASTARRIGLNLSPADFVHSAETANGQARAAVAILQRIEIGRIEMRDVEVVVLEDHALAGVLVGMSFLNRLRRYAVDGGSLVLEQ